MANPILVRITRGDAVESTHRGAIVCANARGEIKIEVGDIDAAVFPRSSVKALQALPLVESGAADAFTLSDAELALACASHNGEAVHVNTARSVLRKIGLDDAALACGPQWPAREADWRALSQAEQGPGRIHNNCSGKHAGMLALARHLDMPTQGYVDRDHPVQLAVRRAVEEMTDTPLATAPCGTDGCSIPTYAVPLRSLATAFARFGAGKGLSPARAKAAIRLRDACFTHPELVAGTDRFCTRIMAGLGGQAFVKTGAEGVFCAAFPALGLGAAMKCDDGATRGAEAMMAAVILHVLSKRLDDDQADTVRAAGFPPIFDRNGTPAGAVEWHGTLS